MKVQTRLVLRNALAGQPCPIDRLFAFLDVLLCCAPLIVETHDPIWFHRQVGDNEAYAREVFTGVPLDLCNDTARLVPRCRLLFEVAIDATHMVWRTSHWAIEQMGNLTVTELSISGVIHLGGILA